MSGCGPHPPTQRKTRGCRTAPVTGVGGCPRDSRVFLARASSCSLRRFATQGKAQATTRPEHIHRNWQRNARLASPRVASRQPRCKSNLPSVSSSSSSFYLEYVISRTGRVEEATAASRSRDCSSPSYYFRSLSLPSRQNHFSKSLLAANSFFFATRLMRCALLSTRLAASTLKYGNIKLYTW